jgi:hypothetical protein
MRKIVATLLVSLDGVVEAPQRWHLAYMDAELAASVGLQLAAADVLLLGRATCGSQAAPSASPAARPWSSR